MTIANYPNSPYPDRPPMEVVIPFGWRAVGSVYWPADEERNIFLRRGWIRYWAEPITSPVDRMMRPKRRGRPPRSAA